MVSKDDLLRVLPMRGLRADYGTKSSRTGGAKMNNQYVGRKVTEEAVRRLGSDA
ncbi:hypothetical protein [Actinophytocola algeriensis]|uniref:Uncharacterized protein n=1 Tax=Actinophytocola algeriensis TaxID=1768010 RepID=A0A7W7QDP7_9PSEU|nr:hypothetical protein [Actinophytocola algeriensis]MBB4911692.1 hypothetical protein [Actinophytocola algeriensis]MBE1473320.1 hypothetical protein [Actinophytocola algeriensis]